MLIKKNTANYTQLCYLLQIIGPIVFVNIPNFMDREFKLLSHNYFSVWYKHMHNLMLSRANGIDFKLYYFAWSLTLLSTHYRSHVYGAFL